MDSLNNKILSGEPKTETERKLVEIWKDVLGLKHVSIHDNFFEIGGDSINAMKILTKVKGEIGKINMHKLFEFQTIHEIASCFDEIEAEPSNNVLKLIHNSKGIDENEFNEILESLD